jgi:hypothetical protein
MSEGSVPTTSKLIVIVEKKTQKGLHLHKKNMFPLVIPYNLERESESENECSVRRGKTLYKLSSFT